MTAEDRAAHVERETVAGEVEAALTDHLAEALGWEWDGGEENVPTVEDVIAGVVADLMPHIRAVLAALPQTGDAAAGRTVTEWRVEDEDGVYDFAHETSARRFAKDIDGEVYSRQRTTFADLVTDWTPAALTAGADQ